MQARMCGGLRRDTKQIGIVVAENNVSFAGKARELIDDKGRAEVAATKHDGSPALYKLERGGEVPQVVVYVGEDGYLHRLLVEVARPGVAL
jgi:hypothetical protein